MPEIFRTAASGEDYREIFHYIADSSPQNAALVLRRLDARLRMLAANNLIGRKRPELAPDVRSFPESSYVIFYKPVENGVILLRVLHSARDITPEYFTDSQHP